MDGDKGRGYDKKTDEKSKKRTDHQHFNGKKKEEFRGVKSKSGNAQEKYKTGRKKDEYQDDKKVNDKSKIHVKEADKSTKDKTQEQNNQQRISFLEESIMEIKRFIMQGKLTRKLGREDQSQ